MLLDYSVEEVHEPLLDQDEEDDVDIDVLY